MKRSFKSELFFSFILIALITLTLSGSFLISAVKWKLEYDYGKESRIKLEDTELLLNGFFEGIEQTILIIKEDGDINKSLKEEDGETLRKAYNELYSITENKRELATFYLYDGEGQCILSTAEADPMNPHPVYWGILKVAAVHPDRIFLRNATYEVNRSNAALCMGQAIIENEECIGYVVAEISKEDMENILSRTVSADDEMVILDEFFEEIYSTKTASELNLSQKLHTRKFYGGRELSTLQRIYQIFQGQKSLSTDEVINDNLALYQRGVERYGLQLVIGRVDIFSDSLRETMLLVVFAVAVAELVISFFIARFLSAWLMSPLESMTEAMGKVREGDLSVAMNSSRQDEFGQLARDFDDMTKALKVYVELRARQQKELSESNIAMMQAQLNPHFLYNTLDSIKWIAKANNIPELATLSSSLAKILRASISADIFVPLSEEIKFVENYIEIQKIRFNGSFSFDAEVPLELEDAIVPKLILQPIVENAIVHGLKDISRGAVPVSDDPAGMTAESGASDTSEAGEGYIFLNVYERDKHLIIYVEDNGCGMDEEMLKTLNERDRDKLKDHIGFYNVDTIIRLHYGLNYGLSAENLKEGGVRVTMELPLRRN
ncbi:MAG: histidine kinase [Lachnospiraceae bacterium]|nr:histidine kinase [Lachnospiraceae bacterium]